MKPEVIVVVVVVVVVFELNRSFYSTTSAVPPVSFLILHPREIQIMWSDTEKEKNQTIKNQGTQIKCWRTEYESATKKNATREGRATKKMLNE